MSLCAACGRPGHRYGRNEGMERHDKQACINGLIGENERLRATLARVPVVSPCEVNPPPPRCGRCDACRELHALDDEVKAWDDDAA